MVRDSIGAGRSDIICTGGWRRFQMGDFTDSMYLTYVYEKSEVSGILEGDKIHE